MPHYIVLEEKDPFYQIEKILGAYDNFNEALEHLKSSAIKNEDVVFIIHRQDKDKFVEQWQYKYNEWERSFTKFDCGEGLWLQVDMDKERDLRP